MVEGFELAKLMVDVLELLDLVQGHFKILRSERVVQNKPASFEPFPRAVTAFHLTDNFRSRAPILNEAAMAQVVIDSVATAMVVLGRTAEHEAFFENTKLMVQVAAFSEFRDCYNSVSSLISMTLL